MKRPLHDDIIDAVSRVYALDRLCERIDTGAVIAGRNQPHTSPARQNVIRHCIEDIIKTIDCTPEEIREALDEL